LKSVDGRRCLTPVSEGGRSVWFGLVGFGLAWFGLVSAGLVWFWLVWFGFGWFGLVSAGLWVFVLVTFRRTTGVGVCRIRHCRRVRRWAAEGRPDPAVRSCWNLFGRMRWLTQPPSTSLASGVISGAWMLVQRMTHRQTRNDSASVVWQTKYRELTHECNIGGPAGGARVQIGCGHSVCTTAPQFLC